MNLPNFKTILQKLSVFKNNVSLLVAVILTVVAGLLFIPTQLMSSGLKSRVQQDSITNGARKIDALMKDAVSPEQYQKELEHQTARATDANDVNLLAEQTTKRELLSYDIFPVDPNAGFSAMIFQVFGQRYRSGIDGYITRVNGRDCPTTAEIQRGLEDASASMRSSRTGSPMMEDYAMASSPRGNLAGLYGGAMGSVQRVIVDEMCLDRAKTLSVYVNPLDVAGYNYWGTYTYDVNMVDAVTDCWYHQLGYWVIEDIFQTIETMNSGHDSVLTAPVKRFLRITFTMGLNRPRSGGGVFRGFRGARRTPTQTAGQQKADADKPAYVLSVSEGLTEPCTGRYSKPVPDGDIDVIHFNAAFVVSTRDVLAFMKALCSGKEHQFKGYPKGQDPPQTLKHNQITILESKMAAPSLNDMSHRYYRYGQDNVVELDLVCEYIFNKKGYDSIKPESVKKTLAGEDQAAK